MKITILCAGKIKERYFTEGIKEYSKRLSRYCKLEVIEVADEKTLDQASAAQEAAIKRKEGERMERCLKPGAYVIALAIDGRQPDSVELSQKIRQLGVMGKSHLIFMIGGSLGMDETLLAKADERMSFSRLTFPHQMMRMILLEQIYRSYRIMNGEPYHK